MGVYSVRHVFAGGKLGNIKAHWILQLVKDKDFLGDYKNTPLVESGV